MPRTPIDHVVLAVSDLDAAAARLWSEHGLEAASPNTFPELGLANRIISVGSSQYLELLAARDATAHPFAATVASLGARAAIGWCLAAEDLESAASRLGLEATPMSLIREDGQRSSWRLVGLAQAMAEPWLPFFIAWDDPDQQVRRLQRAASEAHHDPAAESIAWIEVSGDEQQLRSWLGGLDPPVRIVPGKPVVCAVGIARVETETVLTPGCLLDASGGT